MSGYVYDNLNFNGVVAINQTLIDVTLNGFEMAQFIFQVGAIAAGYCSFIINGMLYGLNYPLYRSRTMIAADIETVQFYLATPRIHVDFFLGGGAANATIKAELRAVG